MRWRVGVSGRGGRCWQIAGLLMVSPNLKADILPSQRHTHRRFPSSVVCIECGEGEWLGWSGVGEDAVAGLELTETGAVAPHFLRHALLTTAFRRTRTVF